MREMSWQMLTASEVGPRRYARNFNCLQVKTSAVWSATSRLSKHILMYSKCGSTLSCFATQSPVTCWKPGFLVCSSSWQECLYSLFRWELRELEPESSSRVALWLTTYSKATAVHVHMFLARVEHRGTGQRCSYNLTVCSFNLGSSSTSHRYKRHFICLRCRGTLECICLVFWSLLTYKVTCFVFVGANHYSFIQLPHAHIRLSHDFPMFECNARLIVLMMDPASHMDGFAGHLYQSLVRSGEGCSRHIGTYWICCRRGSRLWQWILLPFCMCRP